MRENIVIIGRKELAQGFTVKEFLFRNLVPFDYYEYDEDNVINHYLDMAAIERDAFPALIFPDNSVIYQPDIFFIASKIGLRRSTTASSPPTIME